MDTKGQFGAFRKFYLKGVGGIDVRLGDRSQLIIDNIKAQSVFFIGKRYIGTKPDGPWRTRNTYPLRPIEGVSTVPT